MEQQGDAPAFTPTRWAIIVQDNSVIVLQFHDVLPGRVGDTSSGQRSENRLQVWAAKQRVRYEFGKLSGVHSDFW